MKTSTEVLLPIGAHPLAIDQARSLASIARSAAASLSVTSRSHGDVLAYLVNAGIAVELHLKAIMIVARGGRVTKGHNLSALYDEFPDFLKDFIEWQYKQLMPPPGWDVVLTALTFRAQQPPTPGPTPRPRYQTFAEAIDSSSRIFERSRYFFERVNDQDWEIFSYAPGALDAVTVSLDRAYVHFLAGDFDPKPSSPSAHAA